MAAFEGLWGVDVDRTLVEVRKSPKYVEDERLPEMVKRMMARMKIRVTASDFTYVRGQRESTLAYTVDRADSDSAVVKCMASPGKIVTLVFHVRGEGLMSFKSSATDDMDYYIWRRLDPDTPDAKP